LSQQHNEVLQSQLDRELRYPGSGSIMLSQPDQSPNRALDTIVPETQIEIPLSQVRNQRSFMPRRAKVVFFRPAIAMGTTASAEEIVGSLEEEEVADSQDVDDTEEVADSQEGAPTPYEGCQSPLRKRRGPALQNPCTPLLAEIAVRLPKASPAGVSAAALAKIRAFSEGSVRLDTASRCTLQWEHQQPQKKQRQEGKPRAKVPSAADPAAFYQRTAAYSKAAVGSLQKVGQAALQRRSY
jgi:hypothetical protein